MKLALAAFLLLISCDSYGQPWKRPLNICRSNAGANFTNIQTFQDSSGVPSAIRLQSGVLIAAFQWFRQPQGSLSWDRVAVKFSSDNGANWSNPQPIVVTNLPTNFARPFDPTLIQLDDGRIRIYFSSGLNVVLDTSINTYSAISTDGINYTMEGGVRFSMPDVPVIDPAVIKFKNLWHLENPYLGGGYHNISSDGLTFTRVVDIVSDQQHNWTGNYMIKDTNELRFYGSGAQIWYASSSNGGGWSTYTNTNINGGDPTVVKISDTNYVMIYTGQTYPVSVSSNSEFVNDFVLEQNYPNPFNPVTKINYELKIANYVSLKVYDIQGREVVSLVNEYQNAGSYSVEFNGSELASGIYFYRLEAGDYNETKSMVLMK